MAVDMGVCSELVVLAVLDYTCVLFNRASFNISLKCYLIESKVSKSSYNSVALVIICVSKTGCKIP